MRLLPGRSAATLAVASATVISLLGAVACSHSPQQTTSPTATAPAPTVTLPATATPDPTETVQATAPSDSTPSSVSPPSLKLLKASPDKGPVGTAFMLSGEALPPGTDVDLQWATAVGSYDMKAGQTNVEFHSYVFTPKRITLGHATVDANGGLTAQLIAPEDIGGAHDLYVVAGGRDLAKGGFNVLRSATLTPDQGPVGTPIAVTIRGLGRTAFDSTASLRYDNAYTGEISGITTSGTASFQIRAAGSVGPHLVEVNDAGHSTPYLNLQQSPYADQPWDYNFVFTVTDGNAVPPNTLDWPAPGVVTQPKQVSLVTTADASLSGNVSGSLTPDAGPILSHTMFSARGLAPGGQVDLLWATVRGNRSALNGWDLLTKRLGGGVAGADGSFSADVQVPDDLGGWHVVKLVQNDNVLAEAPFFVQRSLVDVTPAQVKEGQTFTVHIKGVGWTELDNTVAVTYDNKYSGFACGFNSNGDVQIPMVATGGPGTHLIDLYPTVYQGHGEPPWTYQVPELTGLTDGPGLGLGYGLPIFRLAIQVVP